MKIGATPGLSNVGKSTFSRYFVFWLKGRPAMSMAAWSPTRNTEISQKPVENASIELDQGLSQM